MRRPSWNVATCFNPRPCTRGDRSRCIRCGWFRCFNPRPCTRGDRSPGNPWIGSSGFQSTPLHEGRRDDCRRFRVAYIVSIHAPARGATSGTSTRPRMPWGFNPRPCTRGDVCLFRQAGLRRMVSIHAPARGATDRPHNRTVNEIAVSIHAPARGATLMLAFMRAKFSVSIHAPARGATTTRSISGATPVGFNPRPCTRGDPSISRHLCSAGFQSTPLHEGRPPTESPEIGCGCFNPRPCTRGDQAPPAARRGREGFNPRPCTRGDGRSPTSCARVLFQSTPLHEGRPFSLRSPIFRSMFQSTPLHEGRRFEITTAMVQQ